LKTILIFTAGFGEGHNTAARNLRDALLHESDGAVSVEVIDFYALAYGSANNLARRLYLTVINKTPRLWNALYRLLDRPGWFESTLFLQHKLKRLMADTLTMKNPAAVCCTYPGYNYLLAGLKKNFHHATLVTDSISVNSIWHRADTDAYIVPNESTAAVMRKHGVPAEKLHPLGFPAQLDFALPERRLSVPDPADGQAKILYIINSGKDTAPALVRQLLTLGGITLTVTVGRDEKLRARLQDLTADAADRVEILGWTNQIPQLLMTHHLVITKAGGATTQEAIAAECPVIFSQMVPGQEEGNWELLRRADAGYLAADHEEIPLLVKTIFENHASRWRQLRANLRRVNRPDSALQAARFLLEKIIDPPPAQTPP
jgi:UDP-N-acetylglucosamine:LPS N-acetylglucosamine transferase